MRTRNNSARSQDLDARSVWRFKSSTIFSTSPKRARNLAKARAKMSPRKKRLILPSLVWRNRARKRNASRNKRTVHCRLSVQRGTLSTRSQTISSNANTDASLKLDCFKQSSLQEAAVEKFTATRDLDRSLRLRSSRRHGRV